jgi:hypothetical protein
MLLLRVLAFVVLDKFAVDRFAPREALFDAVPVGDVFFAELPTEVNFSAFEESREVDQADIEVFDDAAHALHLFERTL